MTKQEAIQALKQGKKITHAFFTPEEWVKITGCLYNFEDGCYCSPTEFWKHRHSESWDTGWSIFE